MYVLSRLAQEAMVSPGSCRCNGLLHCGMNSGTVSPTRSASVYAAPRAAAILGNKAGRSTSWQMLDLFKPGEALERWAQQPPWPLLRPRTPSASCTHATVLHPEPHIDGGTLSGHNPLHPSPRGFSLWTIHLLPIELLKATHSTY